MKTRLLILLLSGLVSTIAFAQPPVPNGNFEIWGDGEPANWSTNADSGNGIIAQVPGVTGSAVSGTVIFDGGLGVTLVPSIVTYTEDEIGFPIDEEYPSASFQFKFNPVGNDVLFMTIITYDSEGIQTGLGFTYFQEAATTFTLGEIPINYFSSGTASMFISATISNLDTGIPSEGSSFVLDNFAIENSTSSVQENTEANFSISSIYPNPAIDNVTISYTSPSSDMLHAEIYDLSGKLVKKVSTQTSVGREQLEIELSGINSGLYLLQIQSQDEILTKRLRVLK